MELQQGLLDFMTKKELTQMDVCKALGSVKPTALNLWIKGKYTGNVAKIDEEVKKYLNQNTKKALESKIKVPFVETTVATKIMNVLESCHFESEIAICYGSAGIGKTTAVKQYVENNAGVVLIEADEKNSSGQILRELHEKLGYTGKGSLPSIRKDIINKLKDSERLIIIDEAENLHHQAFTALRRIHDKTDYTFGILFIGTSKLYNNLTRLRADFDYLTSRIGYCVEISKLSKQDTAGIIKSLIAEPSAKLINTFWEISQGKARILTKLLLRALKSASLHDEPVNSEMVIQVSKVLM